MLAKALGAQSWQVTTKWKSGDHAILTRLLGSKGMINLLLYGGVCGLSGSSMELF